MQVVKCFVPTMSITLRKVYFVYIVFDVLQTNDTVPKLNTYHCAASPWLEAQSFPSFPYAITVLRESYTRGGIYWPFKVTFSIVNFVRRNHHHFYAATSWLPTWQDRERVHTASYILLCKLRNQTARQLIGIMEVVLFF